MGCPRKARRIHAYSAFGLSVLFALVAAASFGNFAATSQTRAQQASPTALIPHDIDPPSTNGPLGYATDFDLFVLEDAVLTAGVVSGRVAVGGDASLRWSDDRHPRARPDQSRPHPGVARPARFPRCRWPPDFPCGTGRQRKYFLRYLSTGRYRRRFRTRQREYVGITRRPLVSISRRPRPLLTALSARVAQLPANGTIRSENDVTTLSGTEQRPQCFFGLGR